MIKVHPKKLFIWKTRLRVLIDYADIAPTSRIQLAQSIIEEIEYIEAQEEKDVYQAS